MVATHLAQPAMVQLLCAAFASVSRRTADRNLPPLALCTDLSADGLRCAQILLAYGANAEAAPTKLRRAIQRASTVQRSSSRRGVERTITSPVGV